MRARGFETASCAHNSMQQLKRMRPTIPSKALAAPPAVATMSRQLEALLGSSETPSELLYIILIALASGTRLS